MPPRLTTSPIVLASQSPVRAEILQARAIPFIQLESEFDEEQLHTHNPKSFAYQACKGKLESTLTKLRESGELDSALRGGVLCADSVVSVENRLLRKAYNKQEAINMLKLQSTKRISIITSLAYVSHKGSFDDVSVCHLELARFCMNDMLAYVESQQWRGKAGCVMIEGFHKRYITKQIGLESSALGLSVEKLACFLGVL